MVSPIMSIDINEKISNAAKQLIEEGINALPVSDGEEIVGILSRTDIMKAML